MNFVMSEFKDDGYTKISYIFFILYILSCNVRHSDIIKFI